MKFPILKAHNSAFILSSQPNAIHQLIQWDSMTVSTNAAWLTSVDSSTRVLQCNISHLHRNVDYVSAELLQTKTYTRQPPNSLVLEDELDVLIRKRHEVGTDESHHAVQHGRLNQIHVPYPPVEPLRTEPQRAVSAECRHAPTPPRAEAATSPAGPGPAAARKGPEAGGGLHSVPPLPSGEPDPPCAALPPPEGGPDPRRPPARSRRLQMGMAETMKALPKKRAEDLAERLRLKSCSSRSSSDCCRPPGPPLGAMPGYSQHCRGRGTASGALGATSGALGGTSDARGATSGGGGCSRRSR